MAFGLDIVKEPLPGMKRRMVSLNIRIEKQIIK